MRKPKMRYQPELSPPVTQNNLWLFTFADLMALLMGFFVMMLTLSNIDKEKFEQVMASMQAAFGGMDVIKTKNGDALDVKKIAEIIGQDPTSFEKLALAREKKAQLKTQQDVQKLKNLLTNQIAEAQIEVIQSGRIIVIRLIETISFPAGAITPSNDVMTTLLKIRDALALMDGDILVSGHSDDSGIGQNHYRSNWELSAARAYSVIQVLLRDHKISESRIVLRSFGAARPLVANDSLDNRSKNRRVEIMLDQRDTAFRQQQNAADSVLSPPQSIAYLPPQPSHTALHVLQGSKPLPGQRAKARLFGHDKAPAIPAIR